MEEMQGKCEEGQPHECELEVEMNEYNYMSQVWVKEEVLVKEEVNDLEPEINGKLTSYLEKDHTSSDQYKDSEIVEEQEPITQLWVKQEIKQEHHDPSQVADEQKLQPEIMPDSSDECKTENENVENGDQVKNEEETELQYVKSVCETVQEQEMSASELTLETNKMKYCCRQNFLLGKNCDICKKTTNNPNYMYNCEICDKGFAKKYRLVNHVSVHGDKNFECDICLKLFVNHLTLRRHKLLVHCTERKFLCLTCGKQFKTNYDLKMHLVSHSGERNYSCSLCNKLFVHQRRLTRHLQTHTGNKRFKCAVCLKHFSRHIGLVEHERLHTGEKPYKCDLCGKEFFRRRSMIQHERLHTGVKPHKCDQCEKNFYRRYHLVRHLRGHP